MTATETSFARDFVADQSFKMLIGGEFAGADEHHGGVTETVDPSTGLVLTRVPEADSGDVHRAVEAASAAQPAWRELGLWGRAACFARFSKLLKENRERLAMLDAVDCGNPIRAMRIDVDLCEEYLRAYPPMAWGLHGRVHEMNRGGLHYTLSRPYGVTGRILAFNHPLLFAVSRALPALIVGNTLVMKPAPQTPLSALALGELFAEAFPPGVVNILSGGAAVGDAIVRHPEIKRISFTGSVQTGLAIQRSAAESGHVKHVSLELGGKNAMVVFPDVDVQTAVEGAVFGMNLGVCQGQSCGSNSRVLVHRSIHDEFVEALGARLDRFRVATAYEDNSEMGPLVTQAHFDRVAGYLARGKEEGARLVTGGGRPTDVPDGGFFMRPAAFDGVQQGMTIAREEIFGPVVSVLAWSEFDEMIAAANAVELGLTASVWTDDLNLAHKTAELLDAGYVWVNDSTVHYVGTPFGGTKDSGTGREESEEELLSFLELKAVNTKLSNPGVAMERHGW
ncbi:MAG: aldehyde dehydrogenase family protein [Acidimicrobiales bacterium]